MEISPALRGEIILRKVCLTRYMPKVWSHFVIRSGVPILLMRWERGTWRKKKKVTQQIKGPKYRTLVNDLPIKIFKGKKCRLTVDKNKLLLFIYPKLKNQCFYWSLIEKHHALEQSETKEETTVSFNFIIIKIGQWTRECM